MRIYKEIMEVIGETSPLTLGILGIGTLIAGPVFFKGLRGVAVSVVKGAMDIAEQASNIGAQAKNEWEQLKNEARQHPGPERSVVGASIGGAVGAGLGSTAGPIGAATGGGLGAGVGATVADNMDEAESADKFTTSPSSTASKTPK